MWLPLTLLSAAASAKPESGAAPSSSAELESEALQPDSLIASLARPVPAETVFTERRESPLLAEPLMLSGRLQQPQAGTLLKMVEKPYLERMQISDGRVSVQREGESNREFSLRRAPALVALSAGFEALLSGDVALLKQHFALQVSGTSTAWQLDLIPTERRLAKRIKAMRLYGTGANLRCIDVLQQGGEDSRMWLDAAAGSALMAGDEATRDALCTASAEPVAAEPAPIEPAHPQQVPAEPVPADQSARN